MNDKVIVEVIVPAAEKKFDVIIPPGSRLSEVKKLMSTIISELTTGKLKTEKTSVLCDAESGSIYDINKKVAELGIKNGTKIMFI